MRNFFGIGAEKAGTSWIYACLYEHPEICIPVKELNYFSRESEWEKGCSWYNKFFEIRCRDSRVKVQGEFSTEYLNNDMAIARISKFDASAKLIVSLRDPIHRAYSNYKNDVMAGLSSDIGFTLALARDKGYLEKGLYREQLEKLFVLFPREQVHIIIYEDLHKKSREVVCNLYKFLQVDSSFVPNVVDTIINPSRVPVSSILEQSMNRMAETLAKNRFFNKLWWVIKESGIPKKIRYINARSAQLTIDQETYNSLIPFYLNQKEYVEELCSRKLIWFEKKI